MAHYQAPKQSKISQLIDVIVLLALTFGALFAPVYLGLAGGAKSVPEGAPTDWEGMGQNATEIAQYNALGYTDPAAIADIINARYDYSFSWAALIAMIVIVVGYYVMMLRLSDREYRDVIAEKFDK